MTVSINYGSVADAASPYDATASSSGAVGDILICAATSYEFDSATSGSRTLAMVTAGWTQLGIEEFSIWPTAPNRRIHLALWYKVATTTTDTANVTLSGATYVFLSLNVGIIRLNGLPNIVTAVSALTRRDNIDPAATGGSFTRKAGASARPTRCSWDGHGSPAVRDEFGDAHGSQRWHQREAVVRRQELAAV